MHFLQDLPIKRKLTFITLLASGIALLVACLAFFTFEQVTARSRMVRDLRIIADMTGANCAAAMEFDDAVMAEQTLQSLSAHPSIVHACIYFMDGHPFAQYARVQDLRGFNPPLVAPNGYRFRHNRLELFQRFDLAVKEGKIGSREKSGTIYIAMDLAEMTARVWRYAAIVVVVLLTSVLIALFLATRLQRVISEPIEDLAKTVTEVAVEKNYSLRAVRKGADELGNLIDGFNDMLGQIQCRDTELEAARKNLENRVDERTKELAGSLSLLNATLESTADGILALDLAGRIVCYNNQFVTMWKISPDLLTKKDSLEVMSAVALKTTDPAQFLGSVENHQIRSASEAMDVFRLNDGRTFERFVRPQRIGSQCVGRVIICRDITERKRAEVQLEEASRKAGMAEVATGVLHNVGNVLNSVNISSTLIREHLKNSRLPSLEKLAGLLREHASDLAVFFTADARGKKLPGFVACLAERLRNEHRELENEAELVGKNIEHIKEIVVMQQSYAKVSGVKEMVNVRDLVEDSLRMNCGALDRHGVKLIREFEKVPTVSLERHKVLQILLNLLNNAKYACVESDRVEKRLIVRLAHSGGRIRISVDDNGVGIPSENLIRIFAHGFTTKKNGHGFGLHSGALAAKEMGGALTACSDGPGKGALFTLELPCQSQEIAHE